MFKLTEAIKKNRDDIIKPVAVLLIICIVIPLALALTNRVTADKIAELEEKNSRAAMQRLIDADEFTEAVFQDGGEEFTYYAALKNGKTVGFVFKTSEKGYGGDIAVMTAVNTDGTVKSVAILDVSGETPGLGQNAAKESFYSQYSGKSGGISLVKSGADSGRNEINAVTGATITSTAVNRAVNRALEEFEALSAADDGGENSNDGEVTGSEKQ